MPDHSQPPINTPRDLVDPGWRAREVEHRALFDHVFTRPGPRDAKAKITAEWRDRDAMEDDDDDPV